MLDVEDESLLASYSIDGSEMSPIKIEKAMENFVDKLESFRR